ncbi:hypothetical protein [Streptomyces cinereoruber]
MQGREKICQCVSEGTLPMAASVIGEQRWFRPAEATAGLAPRKGP